MKLLVIWRDAGDEFIQSAIDHPNPINISNPDDWIKLASASEGNSNEVTNEILKQGYDLILVSTYPDQFFV